MPGILRLGRERTLAVVDIGSGYVGCALLAVPQKGRARILAHGHSTLVLEERTDEQAKARVAEEIAEAVGRMQEQAEKTVGRPVVGTVYIVLREPWVSSKVTRAVHAFEEETSIRAQHIASAAKDSLAALSVDTERLLEMSVLAVRLNGYLTAAPEGKYASGLEVISQVSACDPSMRANALAAVESSFPAAKIVWRSSPRVNAAMLLHMKDMANALVVSVGVLATHFMVVHDSVPIEERVVPEGIRSILARVHEGRPPEETLSHFRMLVRDACADDACQNLQKAIAAAEPELVRIFGEAFGALAHERRLPNSLLLVAHQDILPWLGGFLGRIDFTQFTVTAMPFSVSPVDGAHVSQWVESDGTLDTALALDCAHAVLEEQST